jgi:hypothetical protein
MTPAAPAAALDAASDDHAILRAIEVVADTLGDATADHPALFCLLCAAKFWRGPGLAPAERATLAGGPASNNLPRRAICCPCRDGLPHHHSASRPGWRRARWGSITSPVAYPESLA